MIVVAYASISKRNEAAKLFVICIEDTLPWKNERRTKNVTKRILKPINQASFFI